MDEKYRIIRQIFNTFIYRFIGFFIVFFRVYIIGNNFSTTETGAYDQILRIITIGLYAFGMNIYAYMMRTVPGEKEERKVPIYKTLLMLEVGAAVFWVSVIMMFKADVFFCIVVRIPEYVNILRLGFLIIVIQIITMGFSRFYSTIKEIEFSNFIAFFNSGFWILLLLALWGIGVKITLPVFFLSWIIGSSISIILGLKKIGLGKFVKSEIDTSLVKKALLFGTPLILSSVGYDLVSASSSFILSHYHSASSAGIYFMAYRPLTAVYEFVTAVGMTVFVPYIIEAHNLRDMEKKNYYLSIMTKYTFIAALPILTGILIGRADVISFVTKSGYIDSAGIIPFVIIIPLLYIFIYPAHYELYLENKTLFMGIVYFAGGLLNVVLNLLFIPKYSYYAAALATVVSLLAVLVIFYIMTINILHLKWQFMKIGRIAVVSVISGIISYYLYGLFNNFSIEFVRLASLGIIILLIYIPGLYLFTIFEERETNILKQFVRKMFSK